MKNQTTPNHKNRESEALMTEMQEIQKIKSNKLNTPLTISDQLTLGKLLSSLTSTRIHELLSINTPLTKQGQEKPYIKSGK